MSNTIDLIKSAEERKYVKFEELALDSLKTKLNDHPKIQEFKSKLSEIKEAFGKDEKGEDKKGEDKKGEDKKDKDGDED